MRKSDGAPTLVPTDDQTVYLVMDDLGRFGRVWREADVEHTDLETSPASCACAATCRCATCPHHFWILSSAMEDLPAN
jgi:hypothetical protein